MQMQFQMISSLSGNSRLHSYSMSMWFRFVSSDRILYMVLQCSACEGVMTLPGTIHIMNRPIDYSRHYIGIILRHYGIPRTVGLRHFFLSTTPGPWKNMPKNVKKYVFEAHLQSESVSWVSHTVSRREEFCRSASACASASGHHVLKLRCKSTAR